MQSHIGKTQTELLDEISDLPSISHYKDTKLTTYKSEELLSHWVTTAKSDQWTPYIFNKGKIEKNTTPDRIIQTITISPSVKVVNSKTLSEIKQTINKL